MPDLPATLYVPVAVFLVGWLGLYWAELKTERKANSEWSVKVMEGLNESSNAMRELVALVWSLYDDQENSNAPARQKLPTPRRAPSPSRRST